MKILSILTLISFLSTFSVAHAEDQGVDHDSLKTFLDCQVKSASESDCVRPQPKRVPSQARNKNLSMKELTVDKAAVEEFGHPHAVDQKNAPYWQTEMRIPRGSAMPR